MKPQYEFNIHFAPIGDAELSSDLDVADRPPLWYLQYMQMQRILRRPLFSTGV